MTALGEDVILDLSEAARELGVHYQTAYRWVREGALRAVKVGKSYRVQRRDLDQFVQRRESGTAPRPIHVRNWGRQIDRLHEALHRNDERLASDQVDRLAKGGVSPVELCDDLLAPYCAGSARSGPRARPQSPTSTEPAQCASGSWHGCRPGAQG